MDVDILLLRVLVISALFAPTVSWIYLLSSRFAIWRQLYKIKKLIVLWVGIFVIVAMCLEKLYTRPRMDYSVRLIIQCVIVGLITVALLYTLNDKKDKEGGK